MYKQKETNDQIKKKICDAFFALLKHCPPKEAEKIPVTEIAEKAGVSRTAYYRNFHDRSDIVDCYFRDTLWQTFIERTKEYPFWSYAYGEAFFTILKENREILLLMEKHGYLSIIMNVFNEKNEELAGDMPYDSIERFHLYFAAGGSFNVAMMWLKDGCKESPQELARSFVQFTSHCKDA